MESFFHSCAQQTRHRRLPHPALTGRRRSSPPRPLRTRCRLYHWPPCRGAVSLYAPCGVYGAVRRRGSASGPGRECVFRTCQASVTARPILSRSTLCERGVHTVDKGEGCRDVWPVCPGIILHSTRSVDKQMKLQPTLHALQHSVHCALTRVVPPLGAGQPCSIRRSSTAARQRL